MLHPQIQMTTTQPANDYYSTQVGADGGSGVLWTCIAAVCSSVHNKVNQSSGFNIYEGEILIKCHHKWHTVEWTGAGTGAGGGMQTQTLTNHPPTHAVRNWRVKVINHLQCFCCCCGRPKTILQWMEIRFPLALLLAG